MAKTTANTNLPVTINGSELVAVAKTFKSGSTGYWAGDKVVIDGERYQVTCSIVKIGSKPS
jgi:hypothetical protein